MPSWQLKINIVGTKTTKPEINLKAINKIKL